MAEVGESPDVSKTNAEAHLSKKILNFTVPPISGRGLKLEALSRGAAKLGLWCGRQVTVSGQCQLLTLHLLESKNHRVNRCSLIRYIIQIKITRFGGWLCDYLDVYFQFELEIVLFGLKWTGCAPQWNRLLSALFDHVTCVHPISGSSSAR